MWPWTKGTLAPDEVTAQLLRWTPKEPAGRLLPHLGAMNPDQRRAVVARLGHHDREALITLLGDASAHVCEAAIAKAGGVQRPSRPSIADAHVHRQRPPVDELVSALHAGAASEADVLQYLAGPADTRMPNTFSYLGAAALHQLSARALPHRFGAAPQLTALVERCRQRIVEVELARGEAPTEAAELAKSLRHSGGLQTLAGALAALGKEKLVRGWSWQDSLSRKAVYSHLIRVSFPAQEDTPESFRDAVSAAAIPQPASSSSRRSRRNGRGTSRRRSAGTGWPMRSGGCTRTRRTSRGPSIS